MFGVAAIINTRDDGGIPSPVPEIPTGIEVKLVPEIPTGINVIVV